MPGGESVTHESLVRPNRSIAIRGRREGYELGRTGLLEQVD